MKKQYLLTLACLSICLAAVCQDSTRSATAAGPTTPAAAATPAPSDAADPKGAASRKEKDLMAKNLKPADGQALVYILRPSGAAALVKMGVRCDGMHIGATKAATYVYTMLTPGKHVLMSTSENHAKFELTVEAGKTYYVKQEVLMGAFLAETDLEGLDEHTGQKYLSRCKLAKDNVASN